MKITYKIFLLIFYFSFTYSFSNDEIHDFDIPKHGPVVGCVSTDLGLERHAEKARESGYVGVAQVKRMGD